MENSRVCFFGSFAKLQTLWTDLYPGTRFWACRNGEVCELKHVLYYFASKILFDLIILLTLVHMTILRLMNQCGFFF